MSAILSMMVRITATKSISDPGSHFVKISSDARFDTLLFLDSVNLLSTDSGSASDSAYWEPLGTSEAGEFKESSLFPQPYV
jgi:hypothetical protein